MQDKIVNVQNGIWHKSQFIICRKASFCHIGKKYARISLKNLKDKPNLRYRVNVELVIMMRCYFMRVYVKLLYLTVVFGSLVQCNNLLIILRGIIHSLKYRDFYDPGC